MVRYPIGGMLSWALQYVLGYHRLGHEVYIVEKGFYPHACYDLDRRCMTDDPSAGLRHVTALLKRFGLDQRFCFVDYHGVHHGLSKARTSDLFRSADLFVDSGAHGAWSEEAADVHRTALIDGEPGFTQMKWANAVAAGHAIPRYGFYYTNGTLLGSPACSAPTVGLPWRPLFNPVVPELFEQGPPPPPHAAYTTVMNWQSHKPITFENQAYGQKDLEFEHFMDLPSRTNAALEVAVSGAAPQERLASHGWRMVSAKAVTATFDHYRRYIHQSRGEFSVCKNVFVAHRTGWFSDRSAAYLASGRPVVLQETGFSQSLPTGEGLFAVNTPQEAADAIAQIESDHARHAAAARAIAREHLSAEVVLGRMLRDTLG